MMQVFPNLAGPLFAMNLWRFGCADFSEKNFGEKRDGEVAE